MPITDIPIIALEIIARQIYWRIPWMQNKYRHRPVKESNKINYCSDEVKDKLNQIGVKEGSLVMLHSSLKLFHTDNPMKLASQILDDILSLIGDSGTLVMPTHPFYPEDPGFMKDKSNLLLEYNPDKTISRVGAINELFRRIKHSRRSLHPLSSLCAAGPLADELLANNINDDKPLPHGKYSGYYRFCKLNGIVISIGTPLESTMTICHCAEEIRDETWPVKNFFYERKFRISTYHPDKILIVRERRPEYVRSLSRIKRTNDFLREGILHKSVISDIIIDWAHSKDVLNYMLSKNSTYPFYFPRLSIV